MASAQGDDSIPVMKYRYLVYGSADATRQTQARLRQLRAEAMVLADEKDLDSDAWRCFDALARACTGLIRSG